MPTMTFDAWLKELNELMLTHSSVPLKDVPDLATREGYEKDLTPRTFFDAEVKLALTLLSRESPEAPTTFDGWLLRINLLLYRHFNLTLDDLPDLMTRDAFDNGTTPVEFFKNEVKAVLIEEFGDDVEAFWPDDQDI